MNLNPEKNSDEPEVPDAMQRHHDYYVRLQKNGDLKQEDQAQLKLALEREESGMVKPLTE